MIIAFSVPSVPVAQPRQRHRVIAAAKPYAQNYTPTEHPVNVFKTHVKTAASQVYDGPPLEGPLLMNLLFVMPRPQSKMKKSWAKAGSPREPHIGKPDRDNLMKSFQDALEGLLFLNDSQIYGGAVTKVLRSGHEQPHVEVVFSTTKDFEGHM